MSEISQWGKQMFKLFYRCACSIGFAFVVDTPEWLNLQEDPVFLNRFERFERAERSNILNASVHGLEDDLQHTIDLLQGS
jgi:hypothetical protein